MTLHRRQFRSPLFRILFEIGWYLVYPWYMLVNFTVSLYMPTTYEQQYSSCYERFCFVTICAPFLIVIIVIVTPFMLLGLPLWIGFGSLKHGYNYSEFMHRNYASILNIDKVADSSKDVGETSEIFKEGLRDLESGSGSLKTGKKVETCCESAKFTVVTSNTCLLPEALSRTENLPDVVKRARKIAMAIIGAEVNMKDVEDSYYDSTKSPKKFNSRFRKHSKLVNYSYPIDTEFSCTTDFVCLQEVFESDAALAIVDILSRKYRFILHDAGKLSCQQLLNSGLLIASQYPIIDAKFATYKSFEGKEKFISKGALMAKIELGRTSSDKKLVGYLTNTHLQAFGPSEIRRLQLDELQQYISEFQNGNKNEEEVVLFDILCGDFNFDRMSMGEEENASHEIFDTYVDPCIDEWQKYKPWVIGTKMLLEEMHMKHISSPEGLRRALENDSIRPQYLESIYRKDTSDLIPEFNGKRKVDNILYRPATVSKKIDLTVEEFAFITALTTLTDHIPCSMRFTVCR